MTWITLSIFIFILANILLVVCHESCLFGGGNGLEGFGERPSSRSARPGKRLSARHLGSLHFAGDTRLDKSDQACEVGKLGSASLTQTAFVNLPCGLS